MGYVLEVVRVVILGKALLRLGKIVACGGRRRLLLGVFMIGPFCYLLKERVILLLVCFRDGVCNEYAGYGIGDSSLIMNLSERVFFFSWDLSDV